MVPLDLTRERTYEDPRITAPGEHQRGFWPGDHVRLYARDIGDRLAAAGFDVERIRPHEEFGAELVKRCKLRGEEIWLCRPGVTADS